MNSIKKSSLILSFVAFLICHSLSYASCVDLSGSYQLIDSSINKVATCSLVQTSDQILVQSDIPVLNLMSKPGENYGYLLKRIIGEDGTKIKITQTDCSKIILNSEDQYQQSLLIEAGRFPYFGARSPIFVDTTIGPDSLEQNMLITKYTTVSDGERRIYKDLRYTSQLKLDKNKDLRVRYQIKFGNNDSSIEKVECLFSRY
jgi:hypothetical protein